MGSGNGEEDIYGPNNFLDRDIVLVTINYRLSTLGRLRLDSLAVRQGLFIDRDLLVGSRFLDYR